MEYCEASSAYMVKFHEADKKLNIFCFIYINIYYVCIYIYIYIIFPIKGDVPFRRGGKQFS